MDPESTQLLWNLRVALLKAMTESEEMREVLDRLRENGWSAYLVIDGADDEIEPSALEPGERPPDGQLELDLDGSDHSFLRSLGIDPQAEPRRI